METLSRQLARYVCAARDDDFPPRARAMATDAIVDCIGCMIAGSGADIAGIVARSLFRVESAAGGVALIGAAATVAPADAALYHGAIAHALDYDDTNHPAYAHPSAVIVPTALAVAGLGAVNGRDLVSAHILGVEVFGKLGRALNNDHYTRGWHTTATFGTIAAVVVAGRLLRLTEQQLVMAIGIAASAAGGLRANFGTMVKPLHAGYAARNGVLAALLARAGMDASEASLDHRYGYCNVFNDGLAQQPAALRTWGDPLEILTDYGIALKPYPACGATHPGIEAALILHRAIAGREIGSVRAGVCKMAFAPLIHVLPTAPLEGKFSLHYCIAAALLDGKLDLSTFTPDKIADPRIRALVPKIRMEVEPRFADESEFPTLLEVELADGTRLTHTVELALGKPQRWPERAQVKAKFADCARSMLGAAELDRLFNLVTALDCERPAAGVIDALTTWIKT